MDGILQSTVGSSWTNKASIIGPPNNAKGSKVLGVRLPRRVSRATTPRCRAVAQFVGESNVVAAGRVGKSRETKVVIMVDPVEAKRLAAAEMKAIIARNKRKRQREIEAINGGWAVIGLTAGICSEGYTGKSILIQYGKIKQVFAESVRQFKRICVDSMKFAHQQIASYLDQLADILTHITPS